MAKTGVTVRVLSNRLPQMPGQIRAAVVAEVQRATFDVEARAKAKAPVKTGTLRRSIHSVFENGGLTGIVGPSVLYGKFVEFGTRRMGARPYMRPAAEAVLPGFAAAVAAALRGLGGGGARGRPPAGPPPSGGEPSVPSSPTPRPRRPRAGVSPVRVPRARRQPQHYESSGFGEAQRRYREYQRSSYRRRRR